MRKIKFRGLSTVSGEWIYGDLIQRTTDFIFPSGVYTTKIYEYLIEIRPETKGQYTGLKDVNGIEIYEGDIVRITNNFQENEVDYNAQIIFKDGGFCAIDGTEDNYGVRRYRLLDYGLELEVIGNVHDIPEVLQEVDLSEL